MHDSNPTPDEAAGMAWWNGLTETGQAYWLQIAKVYNAMPAANDAWEVSKRVSAREAYAPR
jgi:hypothetical protein